MLTALPCCCSCADKRPQATAYPVYIDGQGMRMKGRRWQRYCRKCYGEFHLGFTSISVLQLHSHYELMVLLVIKMLCEYTVN